MLNSLFSFVIELAAVATLFPLFAWVLTLLLKRRSASLRCRVWMLALIALVLFSPMSRMLPRAGIPWVQEPGAFQEPGASAPGWLEFQHAQYSPTNVILQQQSDVFSYAAHPGADAPGSWGLWIKSAVVGVWACGTLFAFLGIFVSIRLANNLLRHASGDVTEPWATACKKFARKLRVASPRLAISESVAVPMIVGVVSPTILLPKEHVDWTDAERDGVLLHELSHLKRRDPLGLLFSRMVVAIYWFHPFVRAVASQLRLEREAACDDAVLLHGEEPQGYASFLMKLATGGPATQSPALCLAMSEVSPVEKRIDAVLDTEKPRTPMRWSGCWLTLSGLAVIIFIAALFSPVKPIFPIGVFGPKTYTATAWIQVSMNKPYYIYEEKQRDYESFVNTQFVLMRSPLIIDKALENPNLAQIPELKRQRDRSHWVAENLKLEKQQGSEMVTVSFTMHNPKDAEDIVNSIVNAYFEYYEALNSDWNTRMINQLTLELNRQQNAARLLQEEIRRGLQEAARKGGAVGKDGTLSGGFGQSESILRDLHLAEAKLESLRAELQAAKEVLSESVKVPEAVLQVAIENDEEYIALVNQQKEAQKKLDTLQQLLSGEDDPQVINAKTQVREALDRATEYLKTVSVQKVEKLQRELKAKVANTVWEKETAVRSQEILVETLRRRYEDTVKDVVSRTVEVTDVSFQQEQLKRINSLLDLLMNRIVSLQTEMSAPAQVQLRKKAMLPREADRPRWWW